MPFIVGIALFLTAIPFSWSVLQFVALAWLFACVVQRPTRAAMGFMFWSITTFFALHLLWLPESFSKLFGVFGAVMFIPVYLIEGGFWALLTGLVFQLSAQPRARLWLLAFGWVILEWLRHLGELSFPWGTVGYSLVHTPWVQIADLGGIFLLSLMVTVLAACVVDALLFAEFVPSVVMVGMAVAAWGYGITRPVLQGIPRVAHLAQGNLSPFHKASGSYNPLPVYSRLQHPSELSVFPETALYGAELPALGPAPVITGVFEEGYNRISLRKDGATLAQYNKIRLVPFGESFPFLQQLEFIYRPIFGFIGLPNLNSVQQGQDAAPLHLDKEIYGAYVCYESVYPWIAKTLSKNGSGVLINVSNDAWFGSGMGVQQHFLMGSVRAIENRKYLLRAANTGITALVDPMGKTITQLPMNTEGVLQANYQELHHSTPYTRYGDWALWLCALGIFRVLRWQRKQYSF